MTLLLSQLERELLASRAMVGALTSDHLAYKVRYRRIALMLISLATHLQDHVAQVQWTAQSIQDKEAL